MIRRLLAECLWENRLRVAARWAMFSEESSKRTTLNSWLEDVDNRRAYGSVSSALKLLDGQAESPQLLELRRATRQRVPVSALRVGRTITWASAICAAALLVGIASSNLSMPEKVLNYSTGIGERKVVTLEDGSRITLDSSTIVQTKHFNRHNRGLSLIKGRARFDVAHDKSRPFTVAAGDETVIAVGTSFNVEKLRSEVLVTLGEGLVEVQLQTSPDTRKSVWLTPGQELAASKTGSYSVKQVDLRAAEAWEKGQIVLNDRALGDAVEQINRYLTTPIALDPSVAGLKVSGVFNVQDLDDFVDTLTSFFPVQSTRERGRIVLKERH